MWDICIEPPPFFTDKRISVVVPHSERIVRCIYCSGNGDKKCLECHEEGRVKCWNCNGRGTTGYGDEERICPACNGCKQVKCNKCDGRGRQKCSSCHGNGVLVSYETVGVLRCCEG